MDGPGSFRGRTLCTSAEGTCLGGKQLRVCMLKHLKVLHDSGGGDVACGWQAWPFCKVCEYLGSSIRWAATVCHPHD